MMNMYNELTSIKEDAHFAQFTSLYICPIFNLTHFHFFFFKFLYPFFIFSWFLMFYNFSCGISGIWSTGRMDSFMFTYKWHNGWLAKELIRYAYTVISMKRRSLFIYCLSAIAPAVTMRANPTIHAYVILLMLYTRGSQPFSAGDPISGNRIRSQPKLTYHNAP